MKRALISVSNKSNIVAFAERLVALGYEIVSTGGTMKSLQESGIAVTGVESLTGFPECLDGRVKTLHPGVHAGILAVRGNSAHMEHLKAHHIGPIDIVVVNLYPFKQTILKPGATFEEAIENIDIGGPAMVRSAAKNFESVAVITDPADYEKVAEELEKNQIVSGETKLYLSAKAFQHTAYYDAIIAKYMAEKAGLSVFSDTVSLAYEKVQDMRYGENPHQAAAFYKEPMPLGGTLTDAVQLNGKELSFNNINDANGALELLKEFSEPTIVAVKHANPCGVGSAGTIKDAYVKAYACDPVSIYGGIIAANRMVDEATATEIIKCFTEIVMAPDFTPEGLAVLKSKKNLRVLKIADIDKKLPDTALDMKKVAGGILVQSVNHQLCDEDKLQVVTDKKPTEREMADLLFAWKVVKHTKSNSIVVCKDKQTTGLGIGQVNRIWACEQSIAHGSEILGPDSLEGAVLASDAYFPFGDCVEAAAKAGITAIIQPGGSINDEVSLKLCNEYGIAMVFTGIRHFKH